jgi:hypothetical protein
MSARTVGAQCSAALTALRVVWRSEVVADRGAGSLSFSTTHLGSLALLRSRGCLLPYSAWSVRPTGGLGAATLELTLQVRCRCSPGPQQGRGGAAEKGAEGGARWRVCTMHRIML